MPLYVNENALSKARRAHFEKLRKDHVPRYLFRAWSSTSGGGLPISINSCEEIVPPAFVKDTAHKFYEMKGSYIYQMAMAHYRGTHFPLTEFSSWAASLHLVLCYAENLSKGGHKHVHVAVMDRCEVDGEVLVWHVPHLVDINGHHEYLAHGRIRGKGYKAVKFSRLKKSGLGKIFPEYSRVKADSFGYGLRDKCFGKTGGGVVLSSKDLKSVRQVAGLFEHLAFPVAVALICIRPRPWYRQVESKRAGLPSKQDLDFIMDGLGDPTILLDLKVETWLNGDDMVTTTGFPDVKQWIELLRALVQHSVGRNVGVQIELQVPSKPPRRIWRWRTFGKKKLLDHVRHQPLTLSCG